MKKVKKRTSLFECFKFVSIIFLLITFFSIFNFGLIILGEHFLGYMFSWVPPVTFLFFGMIGFIYKVENS